MPVRARLASYIATSARCSERVHVGAVVGAERDADARVELDRDAVERERVARARPAGAPASSATAPRCGQAGEQHGELVAAEAGQRVAAAHRVAQPRRDLDEQLVAVVVAERVVDLLEAVEVDQQQRRRAAVARGARSRARMRA